MRILGLVGWMMLSLSGVVASPIPMHGFDTIPLDPAVNLLSGMDWTADGLVVCDRDGGSLLLIQDAGEVQVLAAQLNTPVDVEKQGDRYLVLEEEAGGLVAIEVESQNRDLLVNGLEHPTAFALTDANTVYITEFDSGWIYRADLSTGSKQPLDIVFDKPADILFLPPDRLLVADQVGLDGRDGFIYTISLDGRILDIEPRLTDPTGLALSPSGNVYATTFLLMGHHMGGRNQNPTGGIVRLDGFGQPLEIASDLVGPTSLEVDPQGNLYVLEEPTDSIYIYSVTGERRALLEGMASVRQAVMTKQGNLFVLEGGMQERLRMTNQQNHHATWATPQMGNWQLSTLAVDGQGYVYLSEPFWAGIRVFDPGGKPVYTFQDIVPYHIAGIPSGGIYAFTQMGNTFFATKLLLDAKADMSALSISSRILASYVISDDHALFSLQDGRVVNYSFITHTGTTVTSAPGGKPFVSLAPACDSPRCLWLMNEETIYFWDETQSLHPVANVSESGTLFSEDNGVLYLSSSGKRYLIRPIEAAVQEWRLY